MKTIVSAVLWTAGCLHFLFVFIVVAAGLALSTPQTIFPMVRRLTRNQLRIMGVRLEIFGLEHFDPDRAYLLMGNHQSMFDLFAIPAAIPMHCVAIEAAYHFTLPLWGYLIRKWGNIPVYRSDLPRAKDSLEKARAVIAAGTPIIVLPEGHRTLTGKIGRFKKGPFHLALAAKADILPFVMTGLYEYCNKQSRHLRPGAACAVFGRPIAYETFKECSVETLRSRVRNAMIRLAEEPRRPDRD